MASKQIVLITGANTGIGITVVRALCASSIAYDIILGSRSVSKGEEAATSVRTAFPNTSSTIKVAQIDIESDESITNLVEFIKSSYDGKLDILVNNAGAAFDAKSSSLADRRAMWQQCWDVNVSGTHVLTEELTPFLLKSTAPRLLFLTSGTACLAETQRTDGPMYSRLNGSPPAGWPKEKAQAPLTYRIVKTGLNMLMCEWTRILKNDGVKVWAISPGFLATGLHGSTAEQKKAIGAGDAQLGGDFIVQVIEGQRDEHAGLAIRRDEVQQW